MFEHRSRPILPMLASDPTDSPTALLQRCGSGPCPSGDCADEDLPVLHRQPVGTGPQIAPPIVHEVLRDPGQPLDPATLVTMNSHFQQDFSRVQVHCGDRAAQSAASVAAYAYTVGPHIVFGPSGYQPHTQAGQRLLAHELTHVAQQHAVTRIPDSGLPIGDSHSPAEAAADRMAADQSFHPASIHPATADRPVLRRQTAPPTAQTTGPSAPSANTPTRVYVRQTMGALLRDWRAAGMLAPPFRPSDVEEIPDLPAPGTKSGSPTTSATSAAPAAGLAGPALAPQTPPPRLPIPPGTTIPPAPVSTPTPNPAPVQPPAPAPEPAPVPKAAPLVTPFAAGAAAFSAVMLYPSSTASGWMDEVNPLTGIGYGSPEEYTWSRRLTVQQQDYLTYLTRARRITPDPAADGDVAPAAQPQPQPQPRRRRTQSCFAVQVPRRGGHARHDTYATKVTGSSTDYFVSTPQPLAAINYDGLQAGTVNVWEVKTGFGWFFNPDYTGLTAATLARWDVQKNLGLLIARRCGYAHLWAHHDRHIVQLLLARWGGIPPTVWISE